MKYPTREEIIEINRLLVAVNRDPHVVHNPANLEFLVNSLSYKYAQKSEEEQVVWKSAFLLHFIAGKGHIFAEGNKRTAFITTLFFLMENNCYLKPYGRTLAKVESLILSTARNELSLTKVAKWVKDNLIHVTPENFKKIKTGLLISLSKKGLKL